MLFTRQNYFTLTMEAAERELQSDGSIQLLDVRTPEEYARGHIPCSINLPVEQAGEIARCVPDLKSRLFVYCLSGARSSAACDTFTRLGYTRVTNIGGIRAWKGETERGGKQ